jgi:uridine kinase
LSARFPLWDSVRAGEEKWIFPFQEDADAIFNTTLIYEPAVLKKHIFPLLNAVQPESPLLRRGAFDRQVSELFHRASVEDEIPPTSILREFVGGNTFNR